MAQNCSRGGMATGRGPRGFAIGTGGVGVTLLGAVATGTRPVGTTWSTSSPPSAPSSRCSFPCREFPNGALGQLRAPPLGWTETD